MAPLFEKKPAKQGKMKALRVTLASKSPARSKKAKGPATAKSTSMSFTEWVAHYVKMSGGNPV